MLLPLAASFYLHVTCVQRSFPDWCLPTPQEHGSSWNTTSSFSQCMVNKLIWLLQFFCCLVTKTYTTTMAERMLWSFYLFKVLPSQSGIKVKKNTTFLSAECTSRLHLTVFGSLMKILNCFNCGEQTVSDFRMYFHWLAHRFNREFVLLMCEYRMFSVISSHYPSQAYPNLFFLTSHPLLIKLTAQNKSTKKKNLTKN